MDKGRSLKTSKKICFFGNQGALDMRNFLLAFQGPSMTQTVSQWSLKTKVRVPSKANACGPDKRLKLKMDYSVPYSDVRDVFTGRYCNGPAVCAMFCARKCWNVLHCAAVTVSVLWAVYSFRVFPLKQKGRRIRCPRCLRVTFQLLIQSFDFPVTWRDYHPIGV